MLDTPVGTGNTVMDKTNSGAVPLSFKAHACIYIIFALKIRPLFQSSLFYFFLFFIFLYIIQNDRQFLFSGNRSHIYFFLSLVLATQEHNHVLIYLKKYRKMMLLNGEGQELWSQTPALKTSCNTQGVTWHMLLKPFFPSYFFFLF